MQAEAREAHRSYCMLAQAPRISAPQPGSETGTLACWITNPSAPRQRSDGGLAGCSDAPNVDAATSGLPRKTATIRSAGQPSTQQVYAHRRCRRCTCCKAAMIDAALAATAATMRLGCGPMAGARGVLHTYPQSGTNVGRGYMTGEDDTQQARLRACACPSACEAI